MATADPLSNAAPLSVADALALVVAHAHAFPAEEIALADATGRVLAADIVALRDLPGFDNSQMDGYALRLGQDVLVANGQPLEFQLIGALPAGSQEDLAISSAEAVRVFTGGPLPRAANAVVMQEQVERLGETHIRLLASVEEGQYIRRAGSDVPAGEIALRRGDALTPAAIGLLASLGVERVAVHRQPTIAILSTGDELVPPGQVPGLNQTIEGNSLMLAAALRGLGVHDVTVVRERDDPGSIRLALQGLLQRCDLLLITGGVSVGDHDHVKGLLHELGVEQIFWRVRQRPGKPLFYGNRDGTLVLGLPGNPASTLFTFYYYGWPVIRALQGFTGEALHLTRRWATLEAPAKGVMGVTQFLRGEWKSESVRALGGQGSHQIRPFALANCLIVLPERDGMYTEGERVECVMLP